MSISRAKTTRSVRVLAALAALVVAAGTAAPAHASDARKKKHHKLPYSVSESVSRSSVQPGTTVVVSGRVAPKAKGKTVTVQRRVGSGGWVSIARRTLPRSSRYSLSLRLATAGTYGFRTYVPGSKKRRPGLSGVHTVKVASPVWRSVSPGYEHSCGVKSDGSLWCWGWNGYGQTGSASNLGTSTPTPKPQRVGTGRTWVSTTAGEYHSCAVRSDHTAWCWGSNQYGQLGNAANAGTSTVDRTLRQVGGGAVWSRLVSNANGLHTCGIRLNHTLWCWGYDGYGQLGDGNSGSSAEHHTPIQVGSAASWTQVAAGAVHTCARRSDGTLWCWGYDLYGQVGNGTSTTAVTTPAQVGSGTSWTAVSAGQSHSCATRTDRSLWCWGENYYGELGSTTNNTTTNANSTPAQVGSETDWVGPAAGYFTTCARKTDGSARCWGYNYYGALGSSTHVGTSSANPTPLAVIGGGRYAQLGAGVLHTCGVRTDGTAWCWGYNYYGELGNPTNVATSTVSATPLKVG